MSECIASREKKEEKRVGNKKTGSKPMKRQWTAVSTEIYHGNEGTMR
jgi:hypothetical protein